MKDPQRIYKRITRALARGGSTSQKELAECLGVSAAAVSRALGKLEEAGLVRRGADKDGARQIDRFCIGDAPMLVVARLSKNDMGFEYTTMNFDGSDTRCERIPFRPELSFDDNCKTAVVDVAMRKRLLGSSGRAVALGVIDDASRLDFWKKNGVDIAVSESGFAYALCEMRGGVCLCFEVVSEEDVKLSVMLDGKTVCNPGLNGEQDIAKASELAAVMNIERVFMFAPKELEALAEEKLRTCFEALGRPVDIANCSTPYQEALLCEMLGDILIDRLV